MNTWILLRNTTKRCPRCKYGLKKIRISNVNIRDICYDCVINFYKTNIKTLYNIPLFTSNDLKWLCNNYSYYVYNGNYCYKCTMNYNHTRHKCLKYNSVYAPIGPRIYELRKLLINESIIINLIIDSLINLIIKDLAFIVLEFYF